MSCTVSALTIYPLKSAAGTTLQSATLDAFGIANDRRWMLVDPAGTFLSQRQLPRMALLHVRCVNRGLVVEAPGMPTLRIAAPPPSAERHPVVVWRDTCEGADCGTDATAWMRDFLGTDCRVVYCPEDMMRFADPKYASQGERVSYADGFPLLIVGASSLDYLNTRLTASGAPPAPMNRFRPNIVITGAPPHDEDSWQEIVIGEGERAVHCRVVKPCARCSIVPVNQVTGVRGREPLATLATYRTREGRVYFGQNAVHSGVGPIRVGDPVRIFRRSP